MSLLTSFHQYITSSDYSTASAGASSAALVATSDYGSLFKTLDSDHVYHITSLNLGTLPTAETAAVRLVSMDSDGAAGSATYLTKALTHLYTAATSPAELWVTYNPPIRLRYSSNAHYLSVQVQDATDSDTVPGIAYSGFTTRAP